MKGVLCLAACLVAGPAMAQQSAHYTIESASFNGEGSPAGGVIAQSAHYTLSMDSTGDAVIGSGLTGPGHGLDGGLVGSYPPPHEVTNLRFTNATTLAWDPDPSIGDYAVYVGTVTRPFDPGFGICAQPPPTLTSPTATAATTPSPGEVLFYLVTSRNRLSEESTKGFTSAGAERANPAPCP
jgi:hypothetical protein